MNIYWNSFRTFFRIGLFTIGGGYAMIPLIEADVVDKNKWVAREDFLDLMAIAQSCPGIFAVNMSIFIGYKLKGVPGSVVCALGTILPSLLIILGMWIPVVSALLIWLLGVSPIYIIIMAGLGGYLYGRYIKPSESK